MRKILIATTIAAAALTACNSGGKWNVEGTASAELNGRVIYLATLSGDNWVNIDSATVANGSFAFKGDRFDAPQIMRLTLDDNTLYLPVDSTETITVDATGQSFANDSRISGSLSADMMQQINDIVNQALANDPAALRTEELKREISQVLSQNLGGIAAYYAVNKTVGNKPLFDASNAFDKRIIGGVATQFSTQHPGDPRSLQLEQLVLNNRRLFNSNPQVIEAEEIPFVDITLTDVKGNKRSLSDVWGEGKTVILNFTSLTAPEAPALNVALNEVYEQYAGRGLEIYQVSVDSDEFLWSSAAKSLPWVSVYCNPAVDGSALVNYNVAGLPTTFVIARDGNRMERVTDLSELKSVVASII